MPKKKLYEALEADESDDKATLTAKYRKRAKDCHPDKRPGDAAAADEFKLITLAFETLSDDAKRARYDTLGEESGITDPMQEALSLIAKFMHMVIKSDLEQGRHPKHRKLMADIIGILEAEINGCEQTIANFRSRLDVLTDVAKRFTCGKGEPNLMEKIALGPIHNIERTIKDVEHDLAVRKDAHGIAKKFRYKTEAMQQVVMTVGTGAASTINW